VRTDDSNSHTTASEIQFLRSAQVLIAERQHGKKALEITTLELARVEERELGDWYRKYLNAAKLRVNWLEMDRDAILSEAKKLYKRYR
jgi:hypothetical protein